MEAANLILNELFPSGTPIWGFLFNSISRFSNSFFRDLYFFTNFFACFKKLFVVLSLITFPFISKGQSEAKFNESMEWLNENPSLSTNEKFVSNSASLITFQVINYPDFLIDLGAMREVDEELIEYKYKDYFSIIYSFNQLYFKLKNKKYNRLDACTFSMNKVIESYEKIIDKDPSLTIPILDEYSKLSEKELKKSIKKLI